MKKIILLMLAALFSGHPAIATEHHSGHGGGGNSGGSSTGCTKPHLSKFLPAHLETVVPGAEFSFIAINIHKPEQISVTVKEIPVKVSAEFKDPYYLIKGKLPDTLYNTAARINIKVRAKSPHCEAETGWLLKIADK